MKKFIIIGLLSLLSCKNAEKKSVCEELQKTNSILLDEIEQLKKENNELKEQIKKCDNWVNMLEEDIKILEEKQ